MQTCNNEYEKNKMGWLVARESYACHFNNVGPPHYHTYHLRDVSNPFRMVLAIGINNSYSSTHFPY